MLGYKKDYYNHRGVPFIGIILYFSKKKGNETVL
jgi:hypothetical protein